MCLKISDGNKDIAWINSTKAICLFLVFLFHSEFYCDSRFFDLTSYYVRFYVSSFFFISGYLLFSKQLFSGLINLDAKHWWNHSGGGKIVLVNGFWRIIVPTIIFCTLIYFPKSIVRGDSVSLYDYFIDSILGKSSWFTWALFWAELLMVIVLLTRIRNVWFYFIFGVAMVLFERWIKNEGLLFLNDEAMPWNYRQGLLACVLLAYGGIYKKYEHHIDKVFTTKKGTIGLLLMTIAYVLIVYNKDSIPFYSSSLTAFSLSFISIFILVGFLKLVKGNTFTNYIGRHSIGFFFICGGLPNLLSLLLLKYLPFSLGAFLPMVVSVISYVIAFFIVYALNEYMPFLFDLRILWNKNSKK